MTANVNARHEDVSMLIGRVSQTHRKVAACLESAALLTLRPEVIFVDYSSTHSIQASINRPDRMYSSPNCGSA